MKRKGIFNLFTISFFVIQGSILTVSGRLTFTSNRSMEIEVLVDVSSLVEPEMGQYRAVSAFFVFISLDKYNRVMSVPPLKVGKASVFKTLYKDAHNDLNRRVF